MINTKGTARRENSNYDHLFIIQDYFSEYLVVQYYVSFPKFKKKIQEIYKPVTATENIIRLFDLHNQYVTIYEHGGCI